MGPTPPRRRWSPKPHEEVLGSIRQYTVPLVGAPANEPHARRVPIAKLPSLHAPTASVRQESHVRAQHEANRKAVRIGCWLKGGDAAAHSFIAFFQNMSECKQDSESQIRRAKLSCQLLKMLAFEFQDSVELDMTRQPKPRTWLLTSLLHHVEASLFAVDTDVETAFKTASHYAAIFENTIGRSRDRAQVLQDLARVNRWQAEEEHPRRLSAQEMWSRRHGLKASEGPTSPSPSGDGGNCEFHVDSMPVSVVSNIQRWHCKQLVNQIRWSNQIISTLDAQSSAAYNMLGLAQELTAGFVVGWAFAFWRLQYKEDAIAAEQLQKAERSSRINRQYVGVFFRHWCLITSRALCSRSYEETKLKKLNLRLLSVRLRDVQAKKTKCQQETVHDKSAHYLIARKMQAAREDRSRLDHRFETMPPVEARRSLHLVAELFMDVLTDFSMLEHVNCRQRLLGKDLIFLASDPTESQKDITALPLEEILVRWVNCILAEARHSASVLLTDAMEDENGRSNWQAADSSRYGFRCREVRAMPAVQTKSFHQFFQDGKILVILYAMFKAYRRKKTTFDPADLALLDEKDAERRAASAQNAFVSLSPLLISRFLLSPLDVITGQPFALKASLSATLLREAAGNLQMQDLSRTRTEPSIVPGRQEEVHAEAHHSMADVMQMFDDLVGTPAQASFVDLSRLCFRWEPITVLHDMGVYDILRRWVNLQVHGFLTPQADGTGVRNLGSDLASGQVLLRLIAAVAPSAMELEKVSEQVKAAVSQPGQAKERDVIKLVLLLTKRCVPFCVLTEEVFLSGQEAALSALVAGMFLCWPNLRPMEDSSLGKMLTDVEQLVQAGLRVASTPRDLVPEDDSNHLHMYCVKSDEDDGKRLHQIIDAIEQQHRLRTSLQRRLQNFLSEVMMRRVQVRLKVKGAGGGPLMLAFQELVRDEDWILLTETEHPATRSSRVRAVVRENLVLIANLMNFFSIRAPNGSCQVCWSGMAQLYREARLYCPCLFLPVDAAQKIFQEVLRAEPLDPQALDVDDSSPSPFMLQLSPNSNGHRNQVKDRSWLESSLGVSGFIRFLLRVCVHREEKALQSGAFAVSLTRSLKEVIGSHLQKVPLDAQEEFTESSHIQEVRSLQEEWEPFLGIVFALYADHGVMAPRREVRLQMGEDSLICLFSDAALLGAALTANTTRDLYRKLISRRHFQPVHANFCFRGQAEVRRTQRSHKRKRNASVPPRIEGSASSWIELRVAPAEKQQALHFQDFQEVCLLAAMYRNPNLVVPLHQRYLQFLSDMLEGLRNRLQPSGASEASLDQLAIQANGVEEWEAKRRSWTHLEEALQASDEIPDAAWSRNMRARELAELRGSEKDLRPGTSRRRSSSAPPTTTVASKFQKALKMAFGTADIRASALSAIKIAAGSLEGLGMPQGSKLSSVLSLLKASKRLGLHLDAADVKKRRSEIGKQAMYRRRSSAMIKVKFMTDRRSGAAGRASMLNSLLPSASGSMQPSRTTSQNVSRAGSFSQETPCA